MRHAPALTMVLLIASATAAPAQLTPPLVRAQLLADTSAIQPNKPFTVGVLLQIEPGWHIYWTNPGDAGAPTTVQLTLPPGMAAGEVRYPAPTRFEQPGDIVAYGYEGSVLLMAEITPPRDLALGTKVPLQARAAWLSCKDVCIPGKRTLALELPVAASGKPDHAELFTAAKASLPVEPKAAGAGATVSGAIPPDADAGRFEINLDWRAGPPADIAWFPGPNPALVISDLQIRTESRRTRITFTARILAGQHLRDKILPGVVAYSDPQGHRRGISVPVHLRKGKSTG